MKKVLEPMNPFNGMRELFRTKEPFATCEYMVDLAVLDHFNLSNLELILNLYFTYLFIDANRLGNPSVNMNSLSFETRETVLKRLGLDIVASYQQFDVLIDKLRESIMNNRPVFLLVDIFYQKGRQFYYKKQHGIHACLVYGFDDENQLFYTLDNIDGYKTYMVSYETIVQYSKGLFSAFDWFRKDSEYFREYVFNNKQPIINDNYVNAVLEKYVINSLDKFDEKLEGIAKLKKLDARLEDIIKLNSFIENLGCVKYKRGSECLVIKNLYKYNVFDESVQPEIDKRLNRILKDWALIRGIVLRYQQNNSEFEEKCSKVHELIGKIYQDEMALSELLYSQFRKYLKN